jgi:hypothetical protein
MMSSGTAVYTSIRRRVTPLACFACSVLSTFTSIAGMTSNRIVTVLCDTAWVVYLLYLQVACALSTSTLITACLLLQSARWYGTLCFSTALQYENRGGMSPRHLRYNVSNGRPAFLIVAQPGGVSLRHACTASGSHPLQCSAVDM